MSDLYAALLQIAGFIGLLLLFSSDIVLCVVYTLFEEACQKQKAKREYLRELDAATGQGNTHPFLRPASAPATGRERLLRLPAAVAPPAKDQLLRANVDVAPSFDADDRR